MQSANQRRGRAFGRGRAGYRGGAPRNQMARPFSGTAGSLPAFTTQPSPSLMCPPGSITTIWNPSISTLPSGLASSTIFTSASGSAAPPHNTTNSRPVYDPSLTYTGPNGSYAPVRSNYPIIGHNNDPSQFPLLPTPNGQPQFRHVNQQAVQQPPYQSMVYHQMPAGHNTSGGGVYTVGGVTHQPPVLIQSFGSGQSQLLPNQPTFRTNQPRPSGCGQFVVNQPANVRNGLNMAYSAVPAPSIIPHSNTIHIDLTAMNYPNSIMQYPPQQPHRSQYIYANSAPMDVGQRPPFTVLPFAHRLPNCWPRPANQSQRLPAEPLPFDSCLHQQASDGLVPYQYGPAQAQMWNSEPNYRPIPVQTGFSNLQFQTQVQPKYGQYTYSAQPTPHVPYPGQPQFQGSSQMAPLESYYSNVNSLPPAGYRYLDGYMRPQDLNNPESQHAIKAYAAEDLVVMRWFREAAVKITGCKLHDHFSLATIAHPLLCSGDTVLLEKYVVNSPELQVQLLEILERLFSDRNYIQEIYQDYGNDYCNPTKCALNTQRIKKLATQWLNRFRADPAIISSIYLDKCQGALAYLIKNTDVDSMSYEAWLENVEDLVKPFPDRLKSFALRQLYNKQKLYQMAYLMQSWGWTMWDGRTVAELQQYAADAEETLGDKVTKVYHPCGLTREAIEWVDTIAHFHSALTEMEEEANCVIGLDCEWNSSRTGFEDVSLALLQVATRNKCYLLDIFTLKHEATEDDWVHLANVLRNPAIRKLGFDLAQDFQMLKPFLPRQSHGFSAQENNVIDVKSAIECIFRETPDVFLNKDIEDQQTIMEVRFALASVVELLFGAPLAKTERMSNWEKRPLREAQIIYAATDAHCLLQVYDYLMELCYGRNIEFPPRSMQRPVKQAKRDFKVRHGANLNPAVIELETEVDSGILDGVPVPSSPRAEESFLEVEQPDWTADLSFGTLDSGNSYNDPSPTPLEIPAEINISEVPNDLIAT